MHQQLITDSLRYAERYHGARPALVGDEGGTTYRELADRCRRLAGLLESHGLGHGDRVAILLSNCPEIIELTFAVPGLGAVLVPLNTRLAGPELVTIVRDCAPTIFITDQHNAELAGEITGHVPTVLLTSDLDPSGYEPHELGEHIEETDPAAIFYTGGTTGDPKGVVLSHRNIVSIAHRLNWMTRFDHNDVILYAIPMFHTAGWMWIVPLTWTGGTHTVTTRFDPKLALEAIERYRVTFQCYLPTMLAMLVDHPDFTSHDTSSLRIILHGGSSPALLERSMAALPGCSFFHAFGMTEASGHLSALRDQQKCAGQPKFRSTGQPAPGIFIDVRRPDGTSCDPMEIGEIVASGANIMSGYWNNPQLTAEVLRGGEYWTGDVGYLDDEFNLYMVDRAKDMIKSGGENVYSAEVERALASFPAVREVAVFGVPDDKWGERVHAAVTVTPGSSTTAEELIAHCRTQIAGYKIPKTFEFHDELPKSNVGKILKRDLRRAHWPEDTGSGQVVTL